MSFETTVNARKAASFFGYARVNLEWFCFNDDLLPLREDELKKTEKASAHLLKVFRLEGCRRLEPENFIDALITKDDFLFALNQANLSENEFKNTCSRTNGTPTSITKLNLHTKIQCLNGLHRTRAAEDFLDNNDQWWVVNLYDMAVFDTSLRTRLYESYSHEQQYTDGTIFRNILKYAKNRDVLNENKWKARLTNGKQKDLKQLLGDAKIKLAFENLIDFVGLWPPIQLGKLHLYHGLRCAPENNRYLKHIHQVWMTIIPESHRCYLDTETVLKLELLAPGVSLQDQNYVKSAMNRQELFPALKDDNIRTQILNAILAQKSLIPSLRTFFINHKFLEPGSQILRELHGLPDKRALRDVFKANYYHSRAKVQYCEGLGSLYTLPGPLTSEKTQMKFAYLQLWMFCLRHFPEMTSIKPRLEKKLKATWQGDCLSNEVRQKAKRDHNPALLQKLACLALNLGFKTPHILSLAGTDAEETQAEQFLRSVRPTWKGNWKEQVATIKEILKEMEQPNSSTLTVPSFVADDSLTWSKDKRCGRPHDDDHEKDKSAMFVSLFYFAVNPGEDITSLFVKRDILKSFFGNIISNMQPSMSAFIRSNIESVSNPDITLIPPVVMETETQRLAAELLKSKKACDELRKAMSEQMKSFFNTGTNNIEETRNYRDQIEGLKSRILELTNELARRESQVTSVDSLRKEISRLQVQSEKRERELELQIDKVTKENDIFRKNLAEKEITDEHIVKPDTMKYITELENEIAKLRREKEAMAEDHEREEHAMEAEKQAVGEQKPTMEEAIQKIADSRQKAASLRMKAARWENDTKYLYNRHKVSIGFRSGNDLGLQAAFEAQRGVEWIQDIHYICSQKILSTDMIYVRAVEYTTEFRSIQLLISPNEAVDFLEYVKNVSLMAGDYSIYSLMSNGSYRKILNNDEAIGLIQKSTIQRHDLFVGQDAHIIRMFDRVRKTDLLRLLSAPPAGKRKDRHGDNLVSISDVENGANGKRSRT